VRTIRPDYRRSILLTALDRSAEEAVERARRTLVRRWPEVETRVLDGAPVESILREAERFRAEVIVVGWRGHGAVGRLLMGSVSRGVVRGASQAVLVARRSLRVQQIVVGFTRSPYATRALELVERLEPPARGGVALVTAVSLITVPSHSLVPGVAAAIAREVKRANMAQMRAAEKDLARAAARLQRRGWRTRTLIVPGEPLRELLSAVARTRAQVLVVGARGTGALRHLMLGSVTQSALNRCPTAVLVVR
jgi:nucleotide-binding universal stress UspA family protein